MTTQDRGPARAQSKTLDIARRISVNASAAADDLRNGEDFPAHLYEHIRRDIALLNEIAAGNANGYDPANPTMADVTPITKATHPVMDCGCRANGKLYNRNGITFDPPIPFCAIHNCTDEARALS